MSSKGKRARSQLRPVAEVLPRDRDRVREAHELRLSGLSWAEVAERTGYADGRVAAMAVNAWLQKTALEAGDDYRHRALDRELERLDRLQSAYWDPAIAGDLKAAGFVLRIVEARSRLFGFDKMQDALEERARTIVIAGSPEEYAAQLRQVLERRKAAKAIEGPAASR